MITTDTIKSLRDQTGVSVMECKRALEEAGGDMEKAFMVLRKKSASVAAKKAGPNAPRGNRCGIYPCQQDGRVSRGALL